MEDAARPHVMFVVNSLCGGGAERVMATLLSHSQPWRAKYRISLALLDRENRAYPLPEWLPVHQLDCRFQTAASFIQLRRLVREQQPALSLSFLTRSNMASCFAMLGRNRPAIISERTNPSTHLAAGLRALATRAFIRAFYPRATRVIAVSEGVREELAKSFRVPQGKMDVIANPVDVQAIRAASAGECAVRPEGDYIVAVGRLVAAKNYSMLVRAFARSAIPGRLVIAGEGPERAALVELARELGIADRIVLPGFLKNPYPLIRGARMFALTSNSEGFPNALVEALALGVPVVATNCRDGPAEILASASAEEIGGGVTVAEAGVLSPVDDVNSYAQALRTALDEPVRTRIIAAGLERVRGFSPDSAAQRYWQIIEGALASNRPA